MCCKWQYFILKCLMLDSNLFHLLAPWIWANLFTSLRFYFSTCKMGLLTQSSIAAVRINELNVCGKSSLTVQFSSVTQSCLTLWDPMNCSMPGLPVHHQLPEFTQTMSIELVMPSSYLILCHPLLLQPPIPPSIRVFSDESALFIRWPKYWSFSFNISRSNEHPGLISFRMDWLDLLAVQGTLKSLLQHHSSKASILWHSAFLIVQLSYPYMTTRETIALTRQTFVGKVMSLPFNMLSRLVTDCEMPQICYGGGYMPWHMCTLIISLA